MLLKRPEAEETQERIGMAKAGSQAKAKEGDLVRIRYVCRLDEDVVFCTSDEDEPCEMRIGDGADVPGLDEAVVGMSPGEQRTVVVPAEMAYGQRKSSKVMKMGRDRLPGDLEVGDVLEIKLKSGRAANFIVMDIGKTAVILDANHPLAGRDLIFDIELVEICIRMTMPAEKTPKVT